MGQAKHEEILAEKLPNLLEQGNHTSKNLRKPQVEKQTNKQQATPKHAITKLRKTGD